MSDSNNNIYDTANQMEKELRETDSFKALEQKFKEIKEDEEANRIFTEFREVQTKLQQKQMMQQEITEEEQEELQSLAGEINENELISGLMVEEQKVSNLINDLNRIITEPLTKLYQQ